MAPRILKRPQVDADLDSIWSYIADENMEAADRVLDRIGDVISMLSEHPHAGRARPELAPGVRSFVALNYVVFYFPMDDGVEIIRILSGYQDYQAQDLE
jgi:toxin ParE1/3/4